MPDTVDSINELNKDLLQSEQAGSGSDPAEARRKAMDHLARREHGRLELQAKLEKAGFEAECARIAVDGLAGEGLQSDRRFIDSFIQSRIGQGKGPVRIRLELEQRCVEAGLVEEVLAACETDWRALARQIREKKFGPGLPIDFREKARQMRFLQYRGFEPGQIQAAVSPQGDE